MIDPMDASRLFHLLVISLFSAAVALIGLNELSNRFMKTSVKDETTVPAGQKLVKELHGDVNVLNPLAGKPTAAHTPEGGRGGQGGSGEAAYGAMRSGWQKVVDKLLPK